MILTAELAEARIKARKVFPGCTWLPGDLCPSGTRALRHNGHVVTILREYTGDSENLRYWWVIDDPAIRTSKGRVIEVLEWPPTLSRVPT